MGILHTALATLKLATATPDAAEINDYVADAHEEAKTEQINFASEIITTNTHDKVLDITNGVKTRLIASQSKSREKIDTDPETKRAAKTLVSKLVNLKDYSKIKAYLAENIATLDVKVLEAAVVVLVEMEEQATSNANYEGGEAARHINYVNSDPQAQGKYDQAIANEREYDKEVSFLIGIESYIKKIIAKKDLENARAQGVVTNYKEIPANSKLDTIIKKLQITFKEDEDGLIGVYVNGKYTNFDIYDPDYDESYDLMTGENIAFIIEKTRKTGKKYFAKFYLDNDKVTRISASKIENLGQPKSFNLSPKQEVSYTKG
jgi:hypothetical protein